MKYDTFSVSFSKKKKKKKKILFFLVYLKKKKKKKKQKKFKKFKKSEKTKIRKKQNVTPQKFNKALLWCLLVTKSLLLISTLTSC